MLQREHYKLDWHRFNLRQKIAGLPPLNAEEFEKKTGAGEGHMQHQYTCAHILTKENVQILLIFNFPGDLSSISGSESDSEDEGSDSKDGVISDFPGTDHESSVSSHSITGRLASKVVLQNSAGEYLSVYRCLLQGKVSHSRYNFTELFKGPLRSSFDLFFSVPSGLLIMIVLVFNLFFLNNALCSAS